MLDLKRIITLLCLATYMVAGAIGVAHAAEFGHDEHEHEGLPCFVQHFMETSGDLPGAETAASDQVVPPSDVLIGQVASVAAVNPADLYHSRAPPHHALF